MIVIGITSNTYDIIILLLDGLRNHGIKIIYYYYYGYGIQFMLM